MSWIDERAKQGRSEATPSDSILKGRKTVSSGTRDQIRACFGLVEIVAKLQISWETTNGNSYSRVRETGIYSSSMFGYPVKCALRFATLVLKIAKNGMNIGKSKTITSIN